MSEVEKIKNIVQDVLFSHHRENLFSMQVRNEIADEIALGLSDKNQKTENVSDAVNTWGGTVQVEQEKLTKVPIDEIENNESVSKNVQNKVQPKDTKRKMVKPKIKKTKRVESTNKVDTKKEFTKKKIIEAQNSNKSSGLKNLKNK